MSGPDLSGRYADVIPKPASSILLVRDGAHGLEVFMVKRHHKIDFAAGAVVFPGGKVEAADSDAAHRAACIGAAALDQAELGFRMSAIRETFEETGLLLAIEKGGGRPDAARSRALKTRHAPAVARGECAMAEMAAREGLSFQPAALTPFAHWITPPVLPKRFDTRFYIVEIAPEQGDVAGHDGVETVESLWINPAQALRHADENRLTMVFATRLNLVKLAQAASASEAVAQAATGAPVTVTPHVYVENGRRKIDIPVAAGFGGPTFDVGAA